MFVRSNKPEDLKKLLNSVDSRAGTKFVMSRTETKLNNDNMEYAGTRDFAMDYRDLKSACQKIASDGRSEAYKNGVPCEATLRRYRACTREVICTTGRKKHNAKLRWEQ